MLLSLPPLRFTAKDPMGFRRSGEHKTIHCIVNCVNNFFNTYQSVTIFPTLVLNISPPRCWCSAVWEAEYDLRSYHCSSAVCKLFAKQSCNVAHDVFC